MQNPNDLALNMVVFLPLAALLRDAAGIVGQAARRGRLRAAHDVGAIVASGSRGGFLGFAVMLVVLGRASRAQAAGLVLAGVVVVLCALPILPRQLLAADREHHRRQQGRHQSSQARRRLMGESLHAFVAEPADRCRRRRNSRTGTRRDASRRGTRAHNVWLQVAAELGIVRPGGVPVSVFARLCSSAVFQTRRLPAAVARDARTRRACRDSRQTRPTLLDAHSAAMAAVARRLVRLRASSPRSPTTGRSITCWRSPPRRATSWLGAPRDARAAPRPARAAAAQPRLRGCQG